MKFMLSLFISMTAMTGCQQSASSAAGLADVASTVEADASSLLHTLSNALKAPEFAPVLQKTAKSSYASWVSATAASLDDDSFSFAGKTFSSLKSKAKANAINTGGLKDMNALFPNIGGFLAGNGANPSKVSLSDVKAYYKVGLLGLTELTSGVKADDDAASKDEVLGALKVAMLLTAHRSYAVASQSLALLDPASPSPGPASPTTARKEQSVNCPAVSDPDATSGCFRGNVQSKDSSGKAAYPIGFWTVNKDDPKDKTRRWHDAYAPIKNNNNSYVLCTPSQEVAGQDFGWIPKVGGKPGEGESCKSASR